MCERGVWTERMSPRMFELAETIVGMVIGCPSRVSHRDLLDLAFEGAEKDGEGDASKRRSVFFSFRRASPKVMYGVCMCCGDQRKIAILEGQVVTAFVFFLWRAFPCVAAFPTLRVDDCLLNFLHKCHLSIVLPLVRRRSLCCALVLVFRFSMRYLCPLIASLRVRLCLSHPLSSLRGL